MSTIAQLRQQTEVAQTQLIEASLAELESLHATFQQHVANLGQNLQETIYQKQRTAVALNQLQKFYGQLNAEFDKTKTLVHHNLIGDKSKALQRLNMVAGQVNKSADAADRLKEQMGEHNIPTAMPKTLPPAPKVKEVFVEAPGKSSPGLFETLSSSIFGSKSPPIKKEDNAGSASSNNPQSAQSNPVDLAKDYAPHNEKKVDTAQSHNGQIREDNAGEDDTVNFYMATLPFSRL